MDAERYRQVDGIFTAARKLEGPDRAAYLDESCGADVELRERVEALLARLDAGSGAVATDAGRAALARKVAKLIGYDEPSPTEAPLPERIGPFRILRVLGVGGMGVVYEAEQTEPVARRVALKVIKLGMDAKELVARFEAERQALAVMDHPGIARVHDAGTTDEGRPWFAMELVKGLPITQYCDEQELSTRRRLELFVDLCSAVQHAHQKGIIHRDLKPSNVLVTEVDGRPVPKVIDFGIAKALSGSLTDKTLVTQLGQALGTPAYMAPEQARTSRLDVDTRADVYALGVMLFQLLVGCLPFEDYDAWHELLRSLAEGRHDTPTPSRRFAALPGEERSSVAQQRGLNVDALAGQLRRDLDWIVRKAMDPVRSRRYETASALAEDIGRHLRTEPVIARPPTLGYRARTFARRNALGVTVASLVVLFLVAFSVGMGLLWRRSERNLERALKAEDASRREAVTAERTAEFVIGLFEGSNPLQNGGKDLTARELLDQGAARIESSLAAEPVVRAKMLDALGRVYDELGAYDKAEPFLEEAVAIRRRELGDQDLDLATSLSFLGRLHFKRGDYAVALPLFEESLSIREPRLGRESLPVAETLDNIALQAYGLGDRERALALWEECIGIRERIDGADSLTLVTTLMNLVQLKGDAGDLATARSLIERALAIQEKANLQDSAGYAAGLSSLTAVRFNSGDVAGALEAAERALPIAERVLGPDHPDVAQILDNVSAAREAMEDHDGAREAAERALAIKERVFGPDHAMVAMSLGRLAIARQNTGDLAGARSALERAVKIGERASGPNLHQLAASLHALSGVAQRQGDWKQARQYSERALSILESSPNPDPAAMAPVLGALASSMEALGDMKAARPLRERSLAIFDGSLGREHPERVHPLAGLARVLSALGEHAEAERLLREALALAEKSFPPGHPLRLEARAQLEAVLRATGRGKEADALVAAAGVTDAASGASVGERDDAAAAP